MTIADFVADLRAPTPSAAAELAVPQIEEVETKLNNQISRMQLNLKKKLELTHMRLEKCMASRIYQTPLQAVGEKYMLLDREVKRLENEMQKQYKDYNNRAITAIAKLDTLSPLKTLARGYTITTIEKNMIKSEKQLKVGDEITLHFYDGQRDARIIK